jgi:hypothetical protein
MSTIKKIQKGVSLEKDFRDMDDMERRIFITYISEHMLHNNNHFREMVEILTRWEHESPIPSRLDFKLQEIIK